MDPRRHGSSVERPHAGPDGRPLPHREWQDRHGRVLAPSHGHVTIINNYTTNIREVVRVERGSGWYRWGGVDVFHRYDPFGYHWFGWYIGDVYFWTRWHNDRFWWYDPYWHRWCYRHGDYWWYQDPDHVEVIYIYVNNGYYRYDPANGGATVTPDPTPPADVPPGETTAPNEATKMFYSEDGSRIVEISGEGRDAYLRDTNPEPAFEAKWLASGVNDVTFELAESGDLEKITLTTEGGVESYDPDGNELDFPQPAPASLGFKSQSSRAVLGSLQNPRWN